MALASDVMDRAAVFLNDPLHTLWDYTTLLPFLQTAHEELQQSLEENGIPVTFEVASYLTIPAGTLVYNPLPSDFVTPITLEERTPGSVQEADFFPIEQRPMVPSESQAETLRYWAWTGQTIGFVGATTARQVKLRYISLVGEIIGNSSNIKVIGSTTFLASRTAGLAARDIGQNPNRADSLDGRAGAALGKLLNREIKGLQGVPAKRKAYWLNRRRQWLLPSR